MMPENDNAPRGAHVRSRGRAIRAAAKLREDIRPRRFASEGELAFVYGIDVSRVRHLVQTRQIPGPDPLLGKFDLKAVEAAFDRRSGLGSATNAYDAWKERRRAS